MRQENLIDDQFRIIFDLQGYSQADIADSFLSDGAISFHMTEQNTEEFEGFDDIWSAILDERVLIKLTEKVEALRAKAVADALPQARTELESKSDDVSDSGSSAARRKDAAPESPSNFKLIDNTIKSEVQKALYKQFMHESKVENQGLKFDLQRAQEPSQASESEMEADQDAEEEEPPVLPENLQVGAASAQQIEDKPATVVEAEAKEKPLAASLASEPVATKMSREPSATNMTESTVPNQFKAGVERNEEEFKRANADGLGRESGAATSRSPGLSVDEAGPPLGSIPAGQVRSQAQLATEGAGSPLREKSEGGGPGATEGGISAPKQQEYSAGQIEPTAA
jgi:hypothetical protein